MAIPLARMAATGPGGGRQLAAADAGYALLKYVALARLADWLGQAESVGDLRLATGLDGALWGASANHWWDIARRLEAATPGGVLPPSPAWGRLQQHCEALNAARMPRHHGIAAPEERQEFLRATAAVEAIQAAAAPLLELGFVRFRDSEVELLMGTHPPAETAGTWSIGIRWSRGILELDPFALLIGAADADARRDVYIYERLSQRGVIYETPHPLDEMAGPGPLFGALGAAATQVETRGRPPTMNRALAWIAARHRAALIEQSRHVNDLADGDLERELRKAARRAIAREWRAGTVDKPVVRADVARALAALPPDGLRVLFLAGGSGMGKTFELVQWLRPTSDGDTERVPLWIKAQSCTNDDVEAAGSAGTQGEDRPRLLELIAGTAAAGDRPARLSLNRLGALAKTRGLAVALDGLNEARDPGALLSQVLKDLGDLAGRVHIVVSVRSESARRLLSSVHGGLLAEGHGFLEVGPLARAEAARLWNDTRRPGGAPPYEGLSPTLQRLVRVPMMAALARDAGESGSGPGFDADGLVGAFVDQQTAELDRVVLRELAARMFRQGAQNLDAAAFEDASPMSDHLRQALTETGLLARPWAALVDRGLVRVSGRVGVDGQLQVAFAHDRLLQWYASRWLVALVEGTELAATGPGGKGWPAEHERVAGSPALESAIGAALARLHPTGDFLDVLYADPSLHARAVAAQAYRALAETDAGQTQRHLDACWDRLSGRRQSDAKAELVALAADLGHAGPLTRGLAAKPVRDATLAVIARARRHSPELVVAAIRHHWQRHDPPANATGLARHWNGLQGRVTKLASLRHVAQALLYAHIAEGASRERYDPLDELTRSVVLDVVGRGTGTVARALRRFLVETIAVVGVGVVKTIPQGPTQMGRELARFFRAPAAQRAQYHPFVDCFAGRVGPREVAALAEQVVRQHEVGPAALFERAFIAAALRPGTSRDALDLTVMLGRVAQKEVSPVPMTAQSVLYILSSYLERTPPTASDWELRFRQFEELIEGWLAAAPTLRWRSASQHEYKSLFASAHVLLNQRRGQQGSWVVDRIWDDSLGKDRGRALDLLDDLSILGISRGAVDLSLAGLEPYLAADWPDKKVRDAVVELVRAARDRDPESVELALRNGPGKNRIEVARAASHGRARHAARYAIFLDFDDAFVFHEGLRDAVVGVLDGLLTAPSFRSFLSLVLRLVVNRLAGKALFPGVEGGAP